MDPFSIAMIGMNLLGMFNQGAQAKKTQQMYEDEQRKADQIRRINEQKLMGLGEPPKADFLSTYDKALGLQKTMARQEMPGYSEQKATIEQNTAKGVGKLGQLGSGQDTMAGLLGLMSNEMTQLRNLGVTASAYRERKDQGVIDSMYNRIPLEQEQFYTNEFIPYQWNRGDLTSNVNQWTNRAWQMQDMGAAAGIQGANMQNQNMYYMANNPYYQNMFQGMFPGQGPTAGGASNPAWSQQAAPRYNPLTGKYEFS